MHTFRVSFSMRFENEIEAESAEEAQKILDEVGTGDVWNNHDWNLEETERKIVDSWENDDSDDTVEGEQKLQEASA